MRVSDPPLDPAYIVQGLVYSLIDVFEATRDLYQTLRNKDKRDFERALRSRGYPASRSLKYAEDERPQGDEMIVVDKAAVMRQFEIGLQTLGTDFAIGDALSHVSLQSQIIVLQKMLVMTCLYGPTSSESLSHQLSKITKASRAAGTATVDILAAQQRRQQEALSPALGTRHRSATASQPSRPLPHTDARTAACSSSTTLREDYGYSHGRSSSPVKTTILDERAGPRSEKADTKRAPTNAPSSHAPDVTEENLYCPYAVALQRDGAQPLSPSTVSTGVPYCPRCHRTLPIQAWEISQEEADGCVRRFQVSDRFVAKCHRRGPDGQFACVLCSRNAPVVTICGDVKALVKHIKDDHPLRELKNEEDIIEVIEQAVRTRRDDAIGYGAPRSNRRSTSVNAGKRPKSLPAYERNRMSHELRSSPRR